MSDGVVAFAITKSKLQRFQNQQLSLYNTYNNLLQNESASHDQLCTKAKEVIRAREKTSKKINRANCHTTCMAFCLIYPLCCMRCFLMDHDYEPDAIATGLHAEHVPERYKRCGAIPESNLPNLGFKSSITGEVISSAVVLQQQPSLSYKDSVGEVTTYAVVQEPPIRSYSEPAVQVNSSTVVQQRPTRSYTESSPPFKSDRSPFAALDGYLECAFSRVPKVSNTAPVVKQLKIDDMSDPQVMEEIEHGLLSGSVAIELSRAVVDRRLPEVLLAETGRAVCWDVFRTEARRVPGDVVDARIALRVLGDGKLVFFTNDIMTVLGGYIDGGIFVLGTFRVPWSGQTERDFILNCYRDGNLCRVYYAKAPRGALKLRDFLKEVLHIDMKPLPPGEFYDFHGFGAAPMETRNEI
jgi:hypothetical protein